MHVQVDGQERQQRVLGRADLVGRQHRLILLITTAVDAHTTLQRWSCTAVATPTEMGPERPRRRIRHLYQHRYLCVCLCVRVEVRLT